MIGGEQLPFRNKDIVNYSKAVIIFNDNLLSYFAENVHFVSACRTPILGHVVGSCDNVKANEGQLDSELFIVFL